MYKMSPMNSNKPGKWTETCIGLWSRSVFENSSNQQQKPPVCMGINLVRVKDIKIEAIQPTNTVGLQIIIQDSSDVDVEQDQRNKVAKNGPQNGKTVWEQDNNFIGQLTSNFKQWSKEWTESVDEVINSPEKREVISRKLSAGYSQLREWSERFWK